VKLLLKDFQTEAVEKLIRQLRRAAKEAKQGELLSVCLSSATGSGKTVMLTAAIELLLQGDDSFPPMPEAIFLWVTDQPELNEQTRRKMLSSSSVLNSDRLAVIDASFDKEVFRPGTVHLLNTQKLGKEKGLVTAGDDRTYTMWETVSNTASTFPDKFFVIIDEAHRGMMENARARNEATTIIQKFVKGSPGEIPPVPLILGISATPERFNALIAGTERTARSVDVKPEVVRASGLIKETLTLYYPAKDQPTDMTMLRAAVRSWQTYWKRWEDYCKGQGEPCVRPILVVQVEDKSGKQISKTDISEALNVIQSEAGHLSNESFGHSFQEGVSIKVGDQELRYVAPPDVQEDEDLRVIFFKSSLNTGWDCPRAEVMMSFRKAVDATLIAQLVGRMVRTPLARRIVTDESLNSVALYLPHYDKEELKEVIERLTKPDADIMPRVDVMLGSDLVLLKRADGSDAAFAALANIPSYEIPKPRKTSEVRRLMKLARLLANDEIDENAPDKATKKVFDTLNADYGGLKKTKRFKALVEENQKVKVSAVNYSVGTDDAGDAETIELKISPENLEDLFDAAGRKIGEGFHKIWWRNHLSEASTTSERNKAKAEFVALIFVEDDVAANVEKAAQRLVQQWLKTHRTATSKLPDARRQDYDEIRRLASEPEETLLSYPQTIDGSKADTSWQKHLFVNDNGQFPQKFKSSWETKVLEAEFSNDKIIGWLRNPDRKIWSLRIPYKQAGEWQSLYPDFLFIRSEGKELRVDILDPHLLSLDDSPPKAAGLAEYAAKHYDKFGRIELIIVDDDKIRRLDLTDESIRDKVKQVTTHAHLRLLFDQA
jgi:type III restriction enzyme